MRMSENLHMELARSGVEKEVLDAISSSMEHAGCDPYAASYASGMDRSWREFGVDGVELQLLYMLNNMAKWKGEEARRSKKIIKKWSAARSKKKRPSR